MDKAQEKVSALKKFKKLERHLNSSLGDEKRKIKIIRKVEKEVARGEEREGMFVKFFLAHVLFNYFRDSSVEVVIEGINSRGRTQF